MHTEWQTPIRYLISKRHFPQKSHTIKTFEVSGCDYMVTQTHWIPSESKVTFCQSATNCRTHTRTETEKEGEGGEEGGQVEERLFDSMYVQYIPLN